MSEFKDSYIKDNKCSQHHVSASCLFAGFSNRKFIIEVFCFANAVIVRIKQTNRLHFHY